jgi:enoyl-CoA hydratase
VRAQLVDRDGAPRWQPSRLEDVSGELVDRFFPGREVAPTA